jgi:hypothetical protein
MGDTWITNMRHYLDENGNAAAMSGPAANLALFLGSIVGWVTSHRAMQPDRTNVPCRRKPRRVRCVGEIVANLAGGPGTISWHCPKCGDNGVVRGWEGTRWDRSAG